MNAAVEDRPIIWEPTPKQHEFLACPARECLGGGSLGGGKSDALLMAGASQADNPKHRALFLRRSYPMLRDAIDRSHSLFLPLGAEYNKQNSAWRFPSGATLEFGFLDAEDDKYRYVGRQFSCILWDELTLWPNDAAYSFLMTRLRTTVDSGLRLEVRASCTPGGPGHSWVKQRFNIPDDGSASECVDPITGYRRVFVPFRIADNVHLRGGEYERSLRALPEAQRKALVDGFWNCFEGACFSEWNPALHTCDPFPIPYEWEVWRGCDDGYSSPACVLWLAHDRIHDRLYVVQELYARGMTPEDMARAVLQMDDLVAPGRRLDGVIDSASFSDVGMGGGRADRMNSLGLNLEPSEKGVGSRLAGWAAIHSRLALKKDGHPGLIVFRNCRNLIRTLPALPYSRRHPEDVDTEAEDHAPDALR